MNMTKHESMHHSLLDDFGARLDRVEAYLGLKVPSEGEAPQTQAYDAYIEEYLPPFLAACEKLGDHARDLGGLVNKAFAAQRAFLVLASHCKRPTTISPADFDCLSEVQSCIQKAAKIRDNRSEFANHQNMVYEAIQALGWLFVERTPKPAVDSFIDGLDFWGNKIRVQFKTSNPDHIDFVTTLKSLLTRLAQYIKIYHLVGVTWNLKGVDAANYTPIAPHATTGSLACGLARELAGTSHIERGSDSSSGHKKTVLENIESAPPVTAMKPTSIRNAAVCEERNGNWWIEYQTNSEPHTVSGITVKQQVYIFGCGDSRIVLEGKPKSIVIDSCKKTKLIFDNVVSSVEIVNCKDVQVQCKGVVPSVTIDKTDGCLVWISWEGRDVQFVTSKSSEMNVVLPKSANSDDYVEKPIPEQFVHKFMDDLAISSDVSPLYSHS